MTTHTSIALAPLGLLLLAAIGGLILFAMLGKRGRAIVVGILFGGVVAVGVVLALFVSVRTTSRVVVSEPEPITLSRRVSGNSVRMGSQGMEVNTPSARVRMGRGGMEVSTPSSSVRMGPDGMDVVAEPLAEAKAAHEQAMLQAEQVRVEAEQQARDMTQVLENVRDYHQAVSQVRQPSPEPWKSPADLEFAADLHPSAAAAAESLVVEILKLKDATYPAADIRRVQVWAADGLDPEVVSRTLSRLQRKVPGWMVMVEALEPNRPIEESDEQAASLRIEVPSRSISHQATWDHNRQERGGILRMRLSFRSGSIDRSTTFADKPWVESASEFISARPQMKWVAGYSSQNATDRAAARSEALQSAAIQIMPEVRTRLQGRVSFDEIWLLGAIERELSGAAEVRDRFVQTMIVNSGGQIVREAVLVQSGGVVSRVEAAALRHRQQQLLGMAAARESWLATVAAAGGMVVLVCVVGMLLNTITRGYYRGRLAVVCALVVVLVLGGLMVLRFKARQCLISSMRTASYGLVEVPDAARSSAEVTEQELLVRESFLAPVCSGILSRRGRPALAGGEGIPRPERARRDSRTSDSSLAYGL